MQPPITPDLQELPPELIAKPLALVGLSGLDTLNNAIHKAVWDIFTSNRRIERAHVQFKLIDNAYEFPLVKPKRNSYEWYIPKGLLKRNWMNKHLNEIPAVIAIFYDLDWNDVQWNEKVIECASRVQSMRAALDGRSTRVVVVLIQSSPMPAGEDMIASEKATALCASCELNAKSLLVLPHVDHLQGYAVRLENAFYDFAQNYYHVEARNIKSHREHLNKTTHQYLFVRHQFKMGFLNELKQDIHTAHKYSIFGDIFDEAVKLGLPAVQTQHPGLYYQQAAQYCILRRQSCQELCSNSTIYPTPDPLEGINTLEFYGQRPWRPGKLSAEPPNPQLEQNGITALQYLEHHVNHSNAIITMYGLAITQYKAYRCPRTRRHLIIQMADEYIISKDYGKALTLLTHMLWDYRTEKWWKIISSLLLKAIKCAYLTANLQDYIMLTLEALGEHTGISAEDKTIMYENLCNVLNRQLPEPENDLPPSCVQSAISHWQQVLTSQSLQLTLEMGTMVSCVDCKGRFVKNEYEADEEVTVEIYLKSLCLFPINLLRVSVMINTAGSNSECVVNPENKEIIILNSNEARRFCVTFRPDPSNVDNEIMMNGIQLQISNNNATDFVVNLKFSGQGNDLNSTYAELQHFRSSPRNMPDFDNIKAQTATNIVPRHSKLDLLLQHANPALLDEWYEISVNIKNNETHDIRDIRFEISLVDDDGIDSTEFSLSIQFKLEKLPLLVKYNLLKPSEESDLKFFMRTHKVGERTLNCKASFTLDGKQPIASIKTETVNVSIVKPFEITTKYMSMLFECINKFYVGEEFVIMPIINCLSPWSIIIENSSLDFGFGIQNVDKSITSQLKGTTLKHKEKGSEIYLASTSKQSDKLVDVGQYSIKWKRVNGFSAKTEVPLQGLMVDWIPLDIKISLPEHGFVRTPLLVQYHFLNKSHQLIQLDLNMEGSEAFMFAGYKQIHILPGSERIVEYNLYPLIPGSVSLPKLVLSIPDSGTEGPALRQDHLVSLLERALPKYLYVMPQVKGKPKLDPAVISSMMH